MYLSTDEAKARLESPENLSNVEVEYRQRTGRPVGSPRLSPEARSIVAQAARVLPHNALAKMVGLHPRTVSNYSRGVTSNSSAGRQTVNEDLKDNLEKATEDKAKQISGVALDLLMASLESVDLTKIKGEARKVQVAKDLATIHEKMAGKGPLDGVTKVLIYAPRQKTMDSFEVLDIPAQVVNR